MHPRELVQLRQRAASLSMSLTAYVAALLSSDAEDVRTAPASPPRLSHWLDVACAAPVDVGVAPLAELPRCALPAGHDGPCSTRGTLTGH
jgi:hypothetical protein